MPTPELLSPAGSLKTLKYALAFGADAVYVGIPRYSLRVRNNEFGSPEKLAEAISWTHEQGKKLFLASNILPHGAKLKTFLDDLAPVIELGPDAMIMADPGLIHLVRERWPDMPIHLSVQANTTNAAAVKFWQSVGISRVILSRELSLDEVEEIRQACPDIELEVFVHGALCIAYSGRCLLSGYFNHRDANQGTCTNACRWDYQVKDGDTSAVTDASAGVHYIEEASRPGELMPIEEDEHGTYILNSKDLRAVEHVHKLVEIGIDCLKVEGRTKSHYYAARTAQIYRRAIDDALAGKVFDPGLLGELEHLANRGYTDGFYQRHAPQELQNYREGASKARNAQFVAEILGHDPASGLAELDVKNKIRVGDELELATPEGTVHFRLSAMRDLAGNSLDEAPGGGWRVRIPLPSAPGEMGLLARLDGSLTDP